jgi:O-antigen ligase
MSSSPTSWTPGPHGLAVPAGSGTMSAPSLNWWVLLICLVGLIIVLGDGFTRPSMIDAEETAIEPLTYEPYQGAFVFAFFMLPLTLGYATSAGISKKEAVFLWFILCTIAYAKDFSYIGVPGSKLFVTDVVLASLLASQYKFLRNAVRSLGTLPVLAIAAFVLSGVISAARGFLGGEEKALLLRDSAIFVYSLFLLLGFLLISSWPGVRRALLFFTLGAVFCSLNAAAWFVMQPGQRRYMGYGIYVVIALLGLLLGRANGIFRRSGWFLPAVLTIGILLFNARAAYAAMAGAIAVILLVGVQLQKKHAIRARLNLVFKLTAMLCLVLAIVLQTRTGSTFIERSLEEVTAAALDPSQDPTTQFRFMAWAEAITRFSRNPIVGEGYGVPFTFDIYNDDPRPHDTYLTILYKMGIVGIFPFLVLLATFFFRSWRTLLASRNRQEAAWLYILLVGIVAQCLNGLFNYVVESPFMASMFWISIGMGFRVVFMLQSNACGAEPSSNKLAP